MVMGDFLSPSDGCHIAALRFNTFPNPKRDYYNFDDNYSEYLKCSLTFLIKLSRVGFSDRIILFS